MFGNDEFPAQQATSPESQEALALVQLTLSSEYTFIIRERTTPNGLRQLRLLLDLEPRYEITFEKSRVILITDSSSKSNEIVAKITRHNFSPDMIEFPKRDDGVAIKVKDFLRKRSNGFYDVTLNDEPYLWERTNESNPEIRWSLHRGSTSNELQRVAWMQISESEESSLPDVFTIEPGSETLWDQIIAGWAYLNISDKGK